MLRFIGEETYSKGTSKDYLVNEEPTWIVDPLDGTSLLSSLAQPSLTLGATQER